MKIPRQHKDIALRSLSVTFKDEMISFLEMQFPKVIDVVQTSVPLIEVKDRGMDANFLLEDGTILHLEFESKPLTEEDLVRFGHYDLELYRQRKQQIRRVIVFTPDVKQSLTGLDIGSLVQKQAAVYLGQDYDGDLTFEELKEKLVKEEPLKSRDKLNIILLPMMKSNKSSRSLRALELTYLLKSYCKDDLGYYLIGAMVATNYGCIEEPEKKIIQEVLKMAQPFQDLYEDFKQKGVEEGRKEGLEKGRQEGRQKGRQEGRQEGLEKGKIEVARKMLLKNIDIDVIAEITELPVETINKLKDNIN